MATDTKPDRARYAALIYIDGAKLRQLRQDNGLTQTELGERVGLGGSYIGHLERGDRRSCSPGAFVRLRDALGVQDRSELLDTSEDEATS